MNTYYCDFWTAPKQGKCKREKYPDCMYTIIWNVLFTHNLSVWYRLILSQLHIFEKVIKSNFTGNGKQTIK